TWHVSVPVALASLADQSSSEGDVVALPIQATSGGNLTFFAVGLPDGLGIGRDTGLITGRISAGAAADGPFAALVLATDGLSSDELTFTWHVSTPVTLTNPQDQRSLEGATVALQLQASNAAGGTLTYSASGLPGGLSINPATGLISGAISAGASASAPFTVIVNATDGAHSARQTFQWDAVTPTTLTPPSTQSNTVGERVWLPIQASVSGDGVTYSATGLPSGLTIDAGSGFISGTVNASGSYQPTVTVSNGVDSAGGTFLWTVNPAPPASPVTVINPG